MIVDRDNGLTCYQTLVGTNLDNLVKIV